MESPCECGIEPPGSISHGVSLISNDEVSTDVTSVLDCTEPASEYLGTDSSADLLGGRSRLRDSLFVWFTQLLVLQVPLPCTRLLFSQLGSG